MNKHKSSQSGFAHFFLLMIIVLVVIAGVGYLVYSKNKSTGGLFGGGGGGQSQTGWDKGCKGDSRVAMTHQPMNMADVSTVSPMGLIAGAHVTPIDHLYFYPQEGPRDKYPVYAMADGAIIEIQPRGVNVGTGESRPTEYRIVMQHSCQTISYFDLVTKLDDAILQKAPDATTKGFNGRIDIKSGQEIGRIGAQSLDTAIYNLDLTLKGFITPELYKSEPWKIHSDDFFSYFSESMRNEMLAKNARVAEPRSGKIDYDQPGKLIGNWFKEGTNGYAGPEGSQYVGDGSGRGYWSGHLAIFYDAYDPSKVVISIGEFKNGQPEGFNVVGNAPDPAKVDASTGVVKYELTVAAQGANSQPQQGPTTVKGVVLAQVMSGEKLKFEIFPDKTASQVSGFTSAAVTYER